MLLFIIVSTCLITQKHGATHADLVVGCVELLQLGRQLLAGWQHLHPVGQEVGKDKSL